MVVQMQQRSNVISQNVQYSLPKMVCLFSNIIFLQSFSQAFPKYMQTINSEEEGAENAGVENAGVKTKRSLTE